MCRLEASTVILLQRELSRDFVFRSLLQPPTGPKKKCYAPAPAHCFGLRIDFSFLIIGRYAIFVHVYFRISPSSCKDEHRNYLLFLRLQITQKMEVPAGSQVVHSLFCYRMSQEKTDQIRRCLCDITEEHYFIHKDYVLHQIPWVCLKVSVYLPTAVYSPNYDIIFQLQLEAAPNRPAVGLIGLRRGDALREEAS